MLDFISNLNHLYLYPFIFFGYIFVGGLVLIPSIYLAIIDVISLPYLFFTIILSSMFADTFWYYIGKRLKKERIYKIKYLQSKVEEAKKFSDYFTERGVFLVFICKFIYGTRIASHILAGMHRIRYAKFLFAITLGTTIWFLIFYTLIKSLDVGISEAGSVATRIQIIFLISVSVLILINFVTGKYLRKRFFKKMPNN